MTNFHTWVWCDGKFLATGLPGAEVSALMRKHPKAIALIEVHRDHAANLAAEASLELDDLAVEDLESEDERTRLDVVGSSLIVLARTCRLDADNDLLTRPLSVLVTDRLVGVVEDEGDFGQFRQVLEKAAPTLRTDGTAGILHAGLDALSTQHSRALSRIEDDADRLAEALFDDKPLGRAGQLAAFRLRRSLTGLRRITEPMRDVTSTLADAAERSDPDSGQADLPARLITPTTARRFADLSNHADHAADGVESQRDVLSSLYETSLSLSDVRLNMIMKKLSAWAAIIAVPTLITGFMGMNVPYPGYGSAAGVIGSIAVILVAVAVLYLVFRRKEWL